MNKMQQTSLEAYYSLENLGKKQRVIFEVIKLEQPCTDKQIAEAIGMEINRITPRRNELVAMGLVVEHDRVKNEYNRLAIRWKQKSEDVQAQLNLK